MTSGKLQDILQNKEELTIDEIKQIIYELKNDCVGAAEITNRYECGFYNGEINAFYICLDLLDKLDISKESLEKRLIKLEEWKKQVHMQNKVMALLSNMTYGKLSSKSVEMEYYKMKLNEIFGNENYQDTDSVKLDGYNIETSFVDENVRSLYPNCLSCAKCERDVVICKEEGRCLKNA